MSLYSNTRRTTPTLTPTVLFASSPSSPPPPPLYFSSSSSQHHQQRMIPMQVSSFSLEDHDASSSLRHEYNLKPWQHLYVLPVLLLEFLALALTRAVLPRLLLERFPTNVYLVMGVTECIRGLFAFVSCPLFGKLSDVIGRKVCLLVTVAGTCAPVCSLALFFFWQPPPTSTTTSSESINTNMTAITSGTNGANDQYDDMSGAISMAQEVLHPHAITVFCILMAFSGIFSSTFTLVFAYISDTIPKRDERVSAYGLALATFGLSFTIGPMAGGYLAQYNTRNVFVCSLFLTVMDLIYIYAILPESLPNHHHHHHHHHNNVSLSSSNGSIASLDVIRNVSWSPIATMRIVMMDPFLQRVGQVAFLYYTSLWAVISTLTLYATKRFQLHPKQLGEIMSLIGFCTMVAEVVMVRILVPLLGERRCMRLGLAAFCMQCIVLGLAYEGWHLFLCILLSLFGNLVYPSLTSLVSSSVEPSAIGEALGAVNGIKALTEGIGPLVFGSLFTLSEHSALPGWPYLVAALIVYMAYYYSQYLPDDNSDNLDDDYVHELELKKKSCLNPNNNDNDVDDEYKGLLLSEIEEDDNNDNDNEDWTQQLPVTFASIMGESPSPSSVRRMRDSVELLRSP